MKLVSIKQDLLDLFDDTEMLIKRDRPCVLIIRLKYKGLNQDFAVPLRSNIAASTPREQYFALPPRPSTRPHNHHGIHYIKMFPVKKQYLLRYRTEGNPAAMLVSAIINKNEKKIVSGCQAYLEKYERLGRQPYATDIDAMLDKLKDQ